MGDEQGIINQEQADGQSMSCQSDQRLVCHRGAAGFTRRVNSCKFTPQDQERRDGTSPGSSRGRKMSGRSHVSLGVSPGY